MIFTLQGLRALGMLGIFFFHSGLLINGTFPVTFFFMLSGFVLYYNKHNNIEKYKLKENIKWIFNKMRAFYVIHIITFLFSIIIRWEWVCKLDTVQLVKRIILNILLIQSFFRDDAFIFNNLAWFLSITFVLYLLAIPLIKLINRIPENKLIISISLILIIQYILNILNINKVADLYLYSNPFYRVWDFILGMLVAKIFSRKMFRIKSYNIYETSIVIIFGLMYLLSLVIDTGCSYYSLLFIVAIYIFSYQSGWISKILKSDILQKLAKISFEFYMIHELILIVFRKIFINLQYHWLVKNIIICIPAMIISLILAKLINKNITNNINKKKISISI